MLGIHCNLYEQLVFNPVLAVIDVFSTPNSCLNNGCGRIDSRHERQQHCPRRNARPDHDRLIATWNPRQIYFHHQHSSVTGPIETNDVRNWDSGIYKLSEDGDTLTVCIGQLPSK